MHILICLAITISVAVITYYIIRAKSTHVFSEELIVLKSGGFVSGKNLLSGTPADKYYEDHTDVFIFKYTKFVFGKKVKEWIELKAWEEDLDDDWDY